MDQQDDLMQTLAKLRAQMAQPTSPMEMVRASLQRDLGRKQDVPIFNDEQRATLVADIGKIEAFIKSQDGADAVALLVATFEAFEHGGDLFGEDDPKPHAGD